MSESLPTNNSSQRDDVVIGYVTEGTAKSLRSGHTGSSTHTKVIVYPVPYNSYTVPLKATITKFLRD